MKIYEYQAKKLLKQKGLSVPKGLLAADHNNLDLALLKKLGESWVAKAQVHAGGRGKGGGIKVVDNVSDVEGCVEQMLSHNLITPQTGPEGVPVKSVYIEEKCDIKQELYFSIILDRQAGDSKIVLSPSGGSNVESQEGKKSIVKIPLREQRLEPYMIRRAFFHSRLPQSLFKPFEGLLFTLTSLFFEKDMELLEINPLVLTTEDHLVCLDAKMTFDDGALSKHDDIQTFAENEASTQEGNYVQLSGDIGCVVNGAGLGMATMDALVERGHKPANFLDVGGVATEETITKSLERILSGTRINGMLINIFGGIVNCDDIARAILNVVEKKNIRFPIVARLEGTNAKESAQLLKEAGENTVVFAHTITDAIEKLSEKVGKK